MLLLKIGLDHSLDKAHALQQELSNLTDEKEITHFFEDCGGEDLVQSYIRLVGWWDNLTEEWKNKILKVPFRFVPDNLWLNLSKLSFEGVKQWYNEITERSHKQSKKMGRETLSPNIWKRVTSQISPKPKRIKRVLKLHQPVTQEDFNVLQKNYDFTPESLQEFIAQVREDAKEQPIVTESLFPFLKDKGLDPLLILSPNDRFKFVQSQLDERDKQVEQLIEEKQEQQEEISQLKQQ
ncbi:hypothetical protein, partial [Crocosphaera chwakensis]